MRLARSAALWCAATVALYTVSAAPGPLWADSAKLAIYALHAYYPSLSPGDHAGWTLLARGWLALASHADPVRSLHLFSAWAAASAVALLFLLVAQRSGDRRAAHTAAAMLAVSHAHWWAAAVTESYALAIALALAACVLLEGFRGKAAAASAGVAGGLAFACHAMSAVVTVPIFVTRAGTRAGVAVLGWVAGSAPLWLALAGAPADPLTGHHTSHAGSVLWHVAAFVRPSRAPLGVALVLLLLVFGLGPVGGVSLLAARRHGAGGTAAGSRLLGTASLLLAGALVLYLPTRLHLMVGFLVLALLLARPPRLAPGWLAAHLLCQPALYLVAPAAFTCLGHDTLGVRQLPYRTNAWYFLCPIKRFERGPSQYAEALLAAAPPGAVVIADFNPGAVLRLVQERSLARPDVTIVPTAIDETLATRDPAAALAALLAAAAGRGRPVVLADTWPPYYRIAELERRFGAEISPCGPGVVVRLPSAVTPSPP